MVRHVIMWNMKDDLSEAECRKVRKDIKDELVVPNVKSRVCMDFEV